jgi:hypothetical protein
VITFAVLLALMARVTYLGSTLESVPRHVDESCWLQNAYFYNLFFVQRDFSNPSWKSFISYDQPPLAKYVLGAALHVFNGRLVTDPGGIMAWHKQFVDGPFEQGLDRRSVMSTQVGQGAKGYNDFMRAHIEGQPVRSLADDDYLAGRGVMFFFTLLTIACLIVLSYELCRRIIPGLIGAIVLISNPVTIPTFQQAMADAMSSFFVLAAILLLVRVIRTIQGPKPGKRARYIYAVMLGATLGLAMSTKFITSYVVVTVAVVYAVVTVVNCVRAASISTFGERTGEFLSILTSAAVVFVGLNPFLYHDTMAALHKMVIHREMLMHIQWLTQWPPISSPLDRVDTIYREGVLLGFSFDSVYLTPLLAVYLICWMLGIVVITLRSILEIRGGNIGVHAIVGLWIVVTFALNGTNVHMKWDRYFIPFVMASTVCLSSGLAVLGTMAFRRGSIQTVVTASFLGTGASP